MTPEERKARAKIAANERWSRPGARAASAHAVEAWFKLTVNATLEDGIPQSTDALLEVIADAVDGLAIVVPDRDHLTESALYRLSMVAWGHA